MSRVREILGEARDLLKTAQIGFDQAKMGPYHVRQGFRNVAIYGKMVTFCTNNLRGKVTGFDTWDSEAKQRHFDNALCRAMSEARNDYEKRAANPISSSLHIKSFSPGDLAKLDKPPNTIGFFMADRYGGSGWMLKLENGDEFPFYIDLPSEIGEAKPLLRAEGEPLDLVEASGDYLATLESYLDEVERFCEEAAS